jgi:hypothetical protein
MVDPSEIEGAIGGAQEAVTAGAAADELSGRRGDGQKTCANCGDDLHGRYCSSCGQLADLFHRPIWSLIADGLEGLFSLEGRFFRTVSVLMIWPGRVTHNYLSGVRARYMAPFRLFLFASIILFVAVFAATGDLGAIVNNVEQPTAEELGELRATLDEEVGVGNEAARAGVETAIAGIEARQADSEGNASSSNDRFKCALREAFLPEEAASAACLTLQQDGNEDAQVEIGVGLLGLPQGVRAGIVNRLETAIDRPDAWVAAMQRWAPRLVFFLFPVYALFLALTHFWRRKVFLYDHIIVSLHFHSFLFILVLAWLAFSFVLPAAILIPAVLIWSNYALYRTLRLVYADSRFGSITRVILLDLSYLIALAIAVVGLAALGVAFV